MQPRGDRPWGKLHTALPETLAAKDPLYRDVCGKCGAIRIDQQLGLEPTPEAYVASMVAVFEQVRRVLKPTGTLWLNIGDSYTSSGVKSGKVNNDSSTLQGGKATQAAAASVAGRFEYDTKPKDLIGIPWRMAFALQAAGWYLRSDIIWHKPNPMPESVTDRPTKSHEHIFLLSKSARYFYDAKAIAEPIQECTARDRVDNGRFTPDRGYPGGADHGNGRLGSTDTRNARDVWTIATEPYPGAHFATFPAELPRRCILAGCPPGGIVLDPFFGSGTTGMVAEQLGRQWVGIELNPEYVTLAKQRTQQRGLFVAAQGTAL